MPSLTVLGAIIAIGVFGSGLAALCHFTVLQRAGATNAMLVTLIMPLTPILLGRVFIGEQLDGPRGRRRRHHRRRPADHRRPPAALATGRDRLTRPLSPWGRGREAMTYDACTTPVQPHALIERS